MNFLRYCEKDDQKILILQDEIASHFDVQFSLLPYEHVNVLLSELESVFSVEQLVEMKKCVADQSFFQNDQVKRWNKWLEQTPQPIPESGLIDFSGESPALQILRTNYAYRAIESAYIVLQTQILVNMPSEIQVVQAIPGEGSESMTLILSQDEQSEVFLIVGPAFIPKHLDYNRNINQKELIRPFGELVRIFLEDHEFDRVIRYSVLRSIISRDDALARLDGIAQVLSIFRSVQMDDSTYRPSVIRTLVRALIGFAFGLQDHDPETLGDGKRLFEIPLLQGRHGQRLGPSGKQVRMCLTGNYESVSGWVELESTDASKEGMDVQFTTKMSKVADQAHTNAIDQRLENLLVFRGWVFDYMGEIASKIPATSHRFNRLRQFILGKGTIVEAIACAWISKLLRADVVTFYRFDHRAQALEGEALYVANEHARHWGYAHIDLIRQLGKTGKIDESFLFRCCSNGEMIFSNDGQEASEANELPTPMVILANAKLETPGAFFLIPVKHGRRVFGAIECVSFRPFAFDNTSTMLVDEFSELLGKFFIAQANATLLEKVRVTTAPQKWHENQKRRFDDLAVAIADYFLVHSATIWLCDTYNDQRMVLEGAVNRRFGENSDSKTKLRRSKNDLIYLNLRDTGSVTAQAMKSGKVISGKVGEAPFDSKWLEKQHRRSLIDNGIKYVAIVPIRGADKKPIASFTLLSRFAPFSDDWQPQFDFCAKTVATALSDFRIIQRVLNDGLSETTHEILNISTRLQNAADNLRNRSGLVDDVDASMSPQLQLDDIRGFAEALGIVAQIMTPAEFVKSYSEANFLGSPMVHHFVKSLSRTPIRIKEVLNQELANMNQQLRKKKIKYEVDWKCPDRTLMLDSYCTSIPIRNVLENAVKYAPEKSNINIDYEQLEGRKVFNLRISSFGPGMTKAEKNRIFERRFQSESAKKLFAGGRGEGLYQTQALMTAQGGLVSHDQFEDQTFENAVWHVFRLKFEYTWEDERTWGIQHGR